MITPLKTHVIMIRRLEVQKHNNMPSEAGNNETKLLVTLILK